MKMLSKIKNTLVGFVFFLIVSNFSCNSEKIDSGYQEHIFFIDTNKNLQHVIKDNQEIFLRNITELFTISTIKGTPKGFYKDGKITLFYRSGKNFIDKLEFTKNGDKLSEILTLGNIPKPDSDLSPIFFNGEIHLFYKDINKNIQHILWGKDTVVVENWTLRSNAPKIEGTPDVLSFENKLNVFYRDIANHIQNITWINGDFIVTNWTELSDSQDASGDPGVMKVNKQEHLFYQGERGLLHIIRERDKFRKDSWYEAVNSWRNRLKKMSSRAVMAEGRPSAKYFADIENLYYKDVENNIQQIIYEKGGFQAFNWGRKFDIPKVWSDVEVIIVEK